MERETGLEPATLCLGSKRAAVGSKWNARFYRGLRTLEVARRRPPPREQECEHLNRLPEPHIVGDRLGSYFSDALATDVLFLHGGVPRTARDRMVQRFQEDERGPGVFVLSLKAGGTGLNLTGASRVFHFDR